MKEFFWFICSSFLVVLILYRIPQNDSASQNFNFSNSFLGSPKNTDGTLKSLMWILTLIFLILTGFKTLETI
jgi:protein translocase SecG subunit